MPSFGQTTGYRIYTVSGEPVRLPEIQYLLFVIQLYNNRKYTSPTPREFFTQITRPRSLAHLGMQYW